MSTLSGIGRAHLHLDLDLRVHQATVLAVLFALASAVCFGISSALQYRSSNQEAQSAPLDPKLLVRLLKNPLWLLGGVADAAGFGFQVLALSKGSLVLVEPLQCASILVATPLGALIAHRRVSRRELITLLSVVVSLAALLAIARPNEGNATLRPGLVYLICGASIGLIVGCLLLASRAPSPSRLRGALIAFAAGVALGSSSALIKTVTSLFGRHGLGVVTRPATYGLIILGGAALLLTQNAFQAGPLGPTLAIVTVTEPVVGVAVGLAGLHERVATGPLALSIEGLMAVATVVGLVLLSLQTDPGDRHGSEDRGSPPEGPPAGLRATTEV
jgi:drug/metabolite transporter (DMT)-like permease